MYLTLPYHAGDREVVESWNTNQMESRAIPHQYPPQINASSPILSYQSASISHNVIAI